MSTKLMFFISTALTAFVVATLYGVVTKISTNPASVEAAQASAPTAEVVVEPTAEPELTEIVATPLPQELTHDLAAFIASEAIQRQDVYSVELKTIDGVQGYEVVFSSNDVVFIGLNKQVVSISALPTAVVYYDSAPTTLVKATDNGNGGNQNQNKDDDDDDDDDEDDD